MSEKNDFGAFLVGFIVGGLTGAAVSLLFAPQSGEETRALIKDKAIELRDRAAETYDDARMKAEEAWTDAKEKAEEYAQLTKQRTQEFLKKGEKAIEDVQDAAVDSIKPKAKKA